MPPRRTRKNRQRLWNYLLNMSFINRGYPCFRLSAILAGKLISVQHVKRTDTSIMMITTIFSQYIPHNYIEVKLQTKMNVEQDGCESCCKHLCIPFRLRTRITSIDIWTVDCVTLSPTYILYTSPAFIKLNKPSQPGSTPRIIEMVNRDNNSSLPNFKVAQLFHKNKLNGGTIPKIARNFNKITRKLTKW